VKNEMMKGYIDGIILSILNRKDAYGYEITQYIDQITLGNFHLKEGTLYPALKRLEVNHFIEGYWGEQDGGPRRKYYRILEDGKRQLETIKLTWERNMNIINLFLGGSANGYPVVFDPNIQRFILH